jgi:peptide/nickel transport system substrate-binding protein
MRRLTAAALVLTLCLTLAPGGAQTARHPWTRPGFLRMGFSDEPDSLNPMFGHTSATDEADSLIFAPMFRYDEHGNFVPDLATQVPTYKNGGISADGKTITLHVRPGAVWADGAPLTAKDLRFTYRAVMNPRNNVKTREGWANIASFDVPDDRTAVVKLKQTNADILGIFAIGGAAYPPLPEHLLGSLPDINRSAFNAAPLASGPFVLTKWNHGASLEFDPNPRYWRGRPKLDHISWRVIPNSETLVNALSTHEIDVVANVDENLLSRLGRIDGIGTRSRLVANLRHLSFNCSKKALSDVRVRQAIAQAVDWDYINRTVYRNINERATSDILPTSWAAPRIPQWKYDVAGARRLLDAAGFHPGPDGVRTRADGTALRISIAIGSNRPANERTAIYMQQQLKAVGIDLSLKLFAVSFLFAQDGPLYSGTYDLSWTVDTSLPDPNNQANWSGDFIPPKGANTSFYNDPLITKLSEQALRTFDRSRRKALYQQEEERIHELALAVFFYWERATSAYNSDLRNYKPAAYGADNWNAWEWSI